MIRKLICLVVMGVGISLLLNSMTASSNLLARTVEKKNGEGRKLFLQYCVTCHGTDAKGTGPTAKLLKKAPADLTKIEKENGKFPFARIQRVISGEDMLESHGTRDMPVWGTYLRRKVGASFATLEIYNLTKYIETIQQ